MKFKHILLTILALLAALLLAAMVIGSILYYRAARGGEVILQELPSDTSLELGKKFDLSLQCFVPWGQTLLSTVYTPGKGVLMLDKPTAETERITWHGLQKKITIPVKVYQTGELAMGEAALTVERPFFRDPPRKITLNLALNKQKSEPLTLESDPNLPIAGEVVEESEKNSLGKYLSFFAAVVILLTSGIIFYYLKKRSNAAPPQPIWERSLQELDDLKKIIDNGDKPLSWCVTRLTDVVRNYLTVRFNWRVVRQTTEEFFASIKGKTTPLDPQQIHYLEEFMNSADLIKFANVKPDRDMLDQTLDNAGELIRQTAAKTEEVSK